VQVDPFKPPLKPPGTNLLTLKHDDPLSTFAFRFYLRRYNKGRGVARLLDHLGRAVQVDILKIHVESACGFSACNYNVTTCFQLLLSNSTCTATPGGADRPRGGGRRRGERHGHAAAGGVPGVSWGGGSGGGVRGGMSGGGCQGGGLDGGGGGGTG